MADHPLPTNHADNPDEADNPDRPDPVDDADRVLSDVADHPWGKVAASLYDTAQLVARAPWLTGHQARIDYLCARQGPDGAWGGPDGYQVVPTLSAVTGLLAEVRRDPSRQELARAAAAGIRALHPWLAADPPREVPDTIGVELIVPALVEELGELLAAIRVPGLPAGGPPWPRPPAGFDPRVLAASRRRFAAGDAPRKSWALLEVLGPAAEAASAVRPVQGSVCCSAAATAAWLGRPGRDPAAHRFLEDLQAGTGGPVPGVTPITFFEAAWVLNSLPEAGPPEPTGVLLDRLAGGLAEDGAPAAPGLPADADDTAAVLTALLRYGRVRRPDSLLGYRHDGRFACFPGERTPSVSTNAHILEALARYLARRPAERSRYAGPAAVAADWLLAQQLPDGSWWDKWHASPYYATWCTALALWWQGGDPAGRALARTRAWVRDTQRPDGSWGRWQGTVEETAYAVQTLSLPPAGGGTDERDAAAAARAGPFLADPPPLEEHPPLWHAKDLYTPVVVVRAARLAALRCLPGTAGHRRPGGVTPPTSRRRPAGPPR